MGARYALPDKLTPSIVRNFGCIAAREKAHRTRQSQARGSDANVYQKTHCTKNRPRAAPRR